MARPPDAAPAAKRLGHPSSWCESDVEPVGAKAHNPKSRSVKLQEGAARQSKVFGCQLLRCCSAAKQVGAVVAAGAPRCCGVAETADAAVRRNCGGRGWRDRWCGTSVLLGRFSPLFRLAARASPVGSRINRRAT